MNGPSSRIFRAESLRPRAALARWRARDIQLHGYIAILADGCDKSPGAALGLSFFARHASFHRVEAVLNGRVFRGSRGSRASGLEMP